MSIDLQQDLTQLRQQGARSFAQWNADLFDAVVAGPGSLLQQNLGTDKGTGQVLNGYFQLVLEAVGQGLLRQAEPSPAGWTSFTECCLAQLVPEHLAEVAPAKRLALLARIWNLAEGLHREPAWLDRYVSACVADLKGLADIESFLVRQLEPVLLPHASATWEGPFEVQTLDLRPWHEEFLPGSLHLAAPNVLCVADRRLQGAEMGILLQAGKKSRSLGLMRGLGEYTDAGPCPHVSLDDRLLVIGKQLVDLPTLRRCQSHLVVSSGFLAACAVDSQRIWIVESK